MFASPRSRTAGRAVASLGLVALLVGAGLTVTPTSAADPASAVAGLPVRGAVDPVAWHACTDVTMPAPWQCADHEVPVDHARPDGATLSIALVRRPATDPTERIGSLFVNPGGPGGSGIDFALRIWPTMDPEVTARFDVVGFDPRGVGRSRPAPTCAVAATGTGSTAREFFASKMAIEAATVPACLLTSGRTYAYLGSNQVADDLDLLRRAVGDAGLTYWGGSYGTRLGMVYAQRHPTTVRALLLDGSVDPHSTSLSFMAERLGSYDGAYDFFRSRYPATADEIDALLADLDAEGPQEVTLAGVPTVVSRAGVLADIDGVLKSEGKWPPLVASIHSMKVAVVDETTTHAQPLPPTEDDPGDDPTPEPPATPPLSTWIVQDNMSAVLPLVNCSDLGDRPTVDDIVAATEQGTMGPLFGFAMAQGLDMCAGYPVMDPISSAPPAGAPPILVFGATHDPATPYAWAQRMHAFLPGSQLVTYEGAQHVSWNTVPSACLRAAARTYLIDRVLPDGPVTCPWAPPEGDA